MCWVAGWWGQFRTWDGMPRKIVTPPSVRLTGFFNLCSVVYNDTWICCAKSFGRYQSEVNTPSRIDCAIPYVLKSSFFLRILLCYVFLCERFANYQTVPSFNDREKRRLLKTLQRFATSLRLLEALQCLKISLFYSHGYWYTVEIYIQYWSSEYNKR